MKSITIAGQQFEISTPYAAGHALTDAEARALNQVRSENIRNNMAGKVKKAVEEGRDPIPEVQEMDRVYSFAMPGAGGGGRVVRDPVEREARAIAREAIKNKLASETPPRKLKDVDPEKLEANVAKVAAQENVLKLARQRVKQKQSLGDSVLEGSELDA